MSAYRKKLIEVALPLEAINKASAREKSIRHGHPSTLHLWWARRPLAACRAVLFASLVNDPGDDPMYGVSEDIAASERAKLFNLIEELVLWENTNNPRVIGAARAEIARSIAANKVAGGEWKNDQVVVEAEGKRATAHDFKHKLAGAAQVNAFLAEHAPPVLDPFCGGGSIPLEAQRLGLRAYASDLNPVPVLITKALIEIPPKFAGRPPVNPESRGEATPSTGKPRKGKALLEKEWPGASGLAEDVRYYGQWMRDEAEKRIGHLYPKVEVTPAMAQDRPDLLPLIGKKLTIIVWIWARTVASPDPACKGTHVPIVKSLCLSNRSRESVWLEPIVDRAGNTYRFDVRVNHAQPSVTGFVNRRGVTCLLSGTPIPFEYVRNEGKAGRLGTRLIALIAENESGRVYLPAKATQTEQTPAVNLEWIPDTEMASNPFSLRPPLYGFYRYADLFSHRQLAALNTFCVLLIELRQQLIDRGGEVAYANAVVTYLAFAVSKCADYWNSVATWMPRGTVGHTFSKQAIPMTWDYPEANPFADFHCAWHEAVNWVAKVIDTWTLPVVPGKVSQADATRDVRNDQPMLISTDPPYYNNIDYADLSDFFYIWLRRSLATVYPDLFSTIATPKESELVASPYRFNGEVDAARRFFETRLEEAFRRMRAAQLHGYPITVFYAFKQTESDEESDTDTALSDEMVASTGWETMLEGLMKAGFSIEGTWPMRTERTARTMSIGMNALASSIVLVCRPRPDNASQATRKQFITSLRSELPEALRNLQRGNIAPVDLAQAAIGPGMAVFTRYAKVLESDGTPMSVRTALGLINQSLDEVLAEQEGEFDGDTRWALAWFEQFGMDEGPFGDAETLSKAKNTAVNGLVEAGVVKARSGKVKLVARDELPNRWNPATDPRLTAWETTQHLIRALEMHGESSAAVLVQKLGGLGETARDLAYRLYHICERKKWAEEALAYNSLVIAWPELTKLAMAERGRSGEKQADLF